MMTASLLLFVPVALFGLVAGFCFVGCVFNTHGISGPPFTTYVDDDILSNKHCVAFWPLNDSSLPLSSPPNPLTGVIALDVAGKALMNPHPGTYQSTATNPSIIPCPGGAVSPTSHAAASTGSLIVGAPGIVQGDTIPPHDPGNPILSTCMQTDGGFVVVPANSTTNPSGAFSMEAWVQPGWTQSGETHMVIDSRDASTPAHTGFSIRVNDAGDWEAALGVGTSATVVLTGGKADLLKANHVVLVFDGATASLFVNGTMTSAPTPAAGFAANTTQPLVIGAGGAYLGPRAQANDLNSFPLWPFNGRIQDVAIYDVALDATTISNHSQNGNGTATESAGT